METHSKTTEVPFLAPGLRFFRFLRDHPVALWACLFLLLRVFFLLANDGLIFEADREEITSGQLLFKEEFNNSTAARELLRGNGRMLWGLPFCGYGVTGGEFYQVILLSGMMKFLGDSYYTVKVLTLFFTFFTFFIFLTTIERYFGKRAAHLFGPIYILGFPSFLLPSFNAMGNHQEVALFLSMGFMAVSYLLMDHRRQFTLAAYLLVGLSAGFGFLYNTLSASFLVWLAPVGIAVFIRTWKKMRLRLALAGALLVILGVTGGLSPYFPIRTMLIVPLNIDLTLGRDLSFYGGMGMPGFEKHPLTRDMMFLQTFSKLEMHKKGLQFIFRETPRKMYFFKDDRLNVAYMVLLLVMLALFLLFLFRRFGTIQARILLFLSLGFILIHMLVVSASSQSLEFVSPFNILGYRYLMPALPFLFFWIAGLLSLLLSEGPRPVHFLSALLVAAFLLLGVAGYTQHLAPNKFLAYRNLPGFSYQVLAIGAGDYFREYPGPVEVQCEQIRSYLSTCDPVYMEELDEAVDLLCADGGYKLRNY